MVRALVVTLLLATSVQASNNLSVERRVMRFGETLGITVSLEDEFAGIDHVRIPLRNLTITDPPRIESEFSWINGEAVRRKVLRYRAKAIAPGPAIVGPLVLRAGAQRDSMPAIAIDVIPDRAALSNDPEVILRELIATGREPLFVVAQADTLRAHVGEQVIVTWHLYNGASVQQWQIGSIPDLENFWVEELDVRSNRPETVIVAGQPMQRMAVRRAALYPLRSGRHEVGPLEVEAAVLRRTNRGPFSMFEGNLIEMTASSAPFSVDAIALPPGPPVDAIGEYGMQCTPPSQTNGGPVSMEVIVSGTGNLRAASPPSFVSPPDGDVQRIDRGVNVSRGFMTRRWQFLIFPRRSGTLAVPSVAMRVFSTASDSRRTLDCQASTLAVTATARPRLSAPNAAPDGSAARRPYWIAAAVAALCLLIVLPWLRRRIALNRVIARMMSDPEPSMIRDRVHETLESRGVDPAALVREPSDRGDAYRSVRSLLDALDRDRIELADPKREIRRRLRELL